METTNLRYFVEIHEDAQKMRMNTMNRLGMSLTEYKEHKKAIKEAEKNGIPIQMDEFTEASMIVIDTLMALEYGEPRKNSIPKMMENQILNYPISEWIMQQRGISTLLAAGLISYIEPIERFDNISKLWAYCGYGVMDVCQDCGKRVIAIEKRGDWITHVAERLKSQSDKKKDAKPSKNMEPYLKKADAMMCHCSKPAIKQVGQRKLAGSLLDFNPRLKTICWKCGNQFMKQGDLYKDVYQKARANYENRPDLKAEMESRKGGLSKGTGRIHAMAMRKTVKLFLSHLWVTWRKQNGLPVTMPYVFDVMGHSKYIAPNEVEK